MDPKKKQGTKFGSYWVLEYDLISCVSIAYTFLFISLVN